MIPSNHPTILQKCCLLSTEVSRIRTTTEIRSMHIEQLGLWCNSRFDSSRVRFKLLKSICIVLYFSLSECLMPSFCYEDQKCIVVIDSALTALYYNNGPRKNWIDKTKESKQVVNDIFNFSVPGWSKMQKVYPLSPVNFTTLASQLWTFIMRKKKLKPRTRNVCPSTGKLHRTQFC